MAKYVTAKNLSLYNVVGVLPFGLFSGDMVAEVWPSITRGGTKGAG